jgi:transcriptional regulator with XRE-family HTH domain
MTIRSYIRHYRELYGLSSTQLSYRLGISQSSMSRLEKSEREGTITVASLKQAARALGCELEYRFVPKRNPPEDPSPYPGLKRSARLSEERKGELSEELRIEERALYGAMRPEERLKRAFELSDFTKRLRCKLR